MARRLNGVMCRRGKVFADRYHAHQLRTLTEARNAVRYAVANFDEPARRRGEAACFEQADPYSSASDDSAALVSSARTWLLRRVAASA